MNSGQRNKSSIKFAEEEGVESSQRIFVAKSQISHLMQREQAATPTQSTLILNRIFHSCKKYEVPKLPRSILSNEYNQFYSTKNKFVKPYAEHTKYVDNLLKNRPLLRRGPFNVPSERMQPNYISFEKTSKSHLKKKVNRYALNTLQSKKNIYTIQSQKKKDLFNKTIGVQLQRFDQLVQKGKEGVHLQGIMNRIIGAEFVCRELEEKNKRSKTLAS